MKITKLGNKKFRGFSLVELLIVISIISILIGVMVQIMLMYERFNREWGVLSSAALDAKEIAINLELNIVTSAKLEIKSLPDQDKIILDNRTYILYKNPVKKIKEITYLIPYSIIEKEKEKEIKDEIHWKIEYENLNIHRKSLGYVYGISFYVYNKYAEKYREKTVRRLVYYIVRYVR